MSYRQLVTVVVVPNLAPDTGGRRLRPVCLQSSRRAVQQDLHYPAVPARGQSFHVLGVPQDLSVRAEHRTAQPRA